MLAADAAIDAAPADAAADDPAVDELPVITAVLVDAGTLSGSEEIAVVPVSLLPVWPFTCALVWD